MKIQTKKKVRLAMLEKKYNSISEDDIDKSVNWLKDNAEKMAQHKADRIYMEQYCKSLKALLMQKFKDLPISGQEREAYAHPDYIKHLKALHTAVYNDEKHRFEKVHHEAKIEAWRTQQANIRAIKT